MTIEEEKQEEHLIAADLLVYKQVVTNSMLASSAADKAIAENKHTNQREPNRLPFLFHPLKHFVIARFRRNRGNLAFSFNSLLCKGGAGWI